jgi:tRNA A-37 threonylcarbamoyl transferase component Bud32
VTAAGESNVESHDQKSPACTSADSPPDSTRVIKSSPLCIVSRVVRQGQTSYEKRYRPTRNFPTHEAVQAQLRRELTLLNRLKELPGFHRRLHAPAVVSVDVDACVLSVREAPGTSLESLLVGPRGAAWRSETMRQLYLAGRLLRTMQTAPVAEDDLRPISTDPVDLVEYSDVRLLSLAESDYGWPEEPQRRRILAFLAAAVAQAPVEDQRQVWTHQDYAPFNLLYDPSGLTVIDFAMCRVDRPLADVTYFLHRIEMLPLQFPWRRWPIARWRSAFLRGYGRPQAPQSPIYQALAVQHLINRLRQTALGASRGPAQKIHNRWLRWWIWRSLLGIVERRPVST